MTKQEKVLNLLRSGVVAQPNTIARYSGVSNVTATIADLRALGHPIYTRKVNGKTAYSLGRPTQEMVAAAYEISGSSVFKAY